MILPLLLARRKRPRAEWESLFRHLLREEVEPLARPLFLAGFAWQDPDWEEVQALMGVLEEELRPGLREALLSEHYRLQVAVQSWDASGSVAVLNLAAHLVAAAAGVPILLWGDYGHGRAWGLSDLLAHWGMDLEAAAERLALDLEMQHFAYLDATAAYPALAKFKQTRCELGVPSVLDELLLFACPFASKQALLMGLRPQWLRWFGQQHGVQPDTFRDAGSWGGLLSLEGSFQWQRLGMHQTFAPEDWGLPLLEAEAKAKERSLGAALRELLLLLENKSSEEARLRLLGNAALLIQTAKPELGPVGALAEAESALDAQRALHIFEALS